MKKLSLIIMSLLASSAYAAAPHLPAVDPVVGGNGTLYSMTKYEDTASGHTQVVTQNLCFQQTGVQGSNTVGVWYSTTFNRWIGRWRQEGDQVAMIGNFWTDGGYDSMRWELVSATNEGYGHWEEWTKDGGYGNWSTKGNIKLVRLGECAWTPPVSGTAVNALAAPVGTSPGASK
jgi:hypothetical protein